MNRNSTKKEYFEWMLNKISSNKNHPDISYRKLLKYLHETQFRYSIPMDKNREEDGIGLRHRFTYENDYDYDEVGEYLIGPCSVLEMMIALSIRCEETIMDDPKIGDRTGQWFWGMISNLGLSSMIDKRFDEEYVWYNIERFLNRDYEADGKGGLFTIKNTNRDLRKVEIWIQLCWYLDNIA